MTKIVSLMIDWSSSKLFRSCFYFFLYLFSDSSDKYWYFPILKKSLFFRIHQYGQIDEEGIFHIFENPWYIFLSFQYWSNLISPFSLSLYICIFIKFFLLSSFFFLQFFFFVFFPSVLFYVFFFRFFFNFFPSVLFILLFFFIFPSDFFLFFPSVYSFWSFYFFSSAHFLTISAFEIF